MSSILVVCFCSSQKPRKSLLWVSRDAFPAAETYPDRKLSLWISSPRSQHLQPKPLGSISPDTVPISVAVSEQMYGFWKALLSRLSKPCHSLAAVLLRTDSVVQHETKVVLGIDVSLERCAPVRCGCPYGVSSCSDAVIKEYPQRGHGFDGAGFGRSGHQQKHLTKVLSCSKQLQRIFIELAHSLPVGFSAHDRQVCQFFGGQPPLGVFPPGGRRGGRRRSSPFSPPLSIPRRRSPRSCF